MYVVLNNIFILKREVHIYIKKLSLSLLAKTVTDARKEKKITQQAYAQKIRISNLQQMAKTIAYVQEHEYGTHDNLLKSFDEVSGNLTAARKTLKATEAALRDTNQQIHYTGQYLANKKIYGQMLKAKNKGKFRNEHSSEIALYEAAQKFLKDKNPDGYFPSIKELKAEKEKLTIQRSAQKETYVSFSNMADKLEISSSIGNGVNCALSFNVICSNLLENSSIIAGNSFDFGRLNL